MERPEILNKGLVTYGYLDVKDYDEFTAEQWSKSDNHLMIESISVLQNVDARCLNLIGDIKNTDNV